jgi:hypothetical protein
MSAVSAVVERDTIDHGPAGHNDVANAVAGALVRAFELRERGLLSTAAASVCSYHEDRTPRHGYAATREAAMAAFAKAGGGSEAFLILPAKQAKIDGL